MKSTLKTYDELKIPDPTLKKKLWSRTYHTNVVVFCQMSKPSVFVWPLWFYLSWDGIQLSSQISGGCPFESKPSERARIRFHLGSMKNQPNHSQSVVRSHRIPDPHNSDLPRATIAINLGIGRVHHLTRCETRWAPQINKWHFSWGWKFTPN